MNWGVRIASLTSDHFAAPGRLKLRFSAAPGLDPWHGVPGGMQRASRGPAIDLTPRLLVQSVAYCSLQSANTCCLQLSRSEREAVASSCIRAQSRVIAVLHREHNHEAHCVCCHRVHGGRIRRAGTVPGRAASGEDLGVQRKFDLQTSRSTAFVRESALCRVWQL